MARGGGYYLPLNKNNKGVSELVGTFTHHEKNWRNRGVNPTHIGD